MDEEERRDINGRLSLVYGISYRLPARRIDWTGETFAGGRHSVELGMIRVPGGAISAMVAGYGDFAAMEAQQREGSFRPLRTRFEMISFLLEWREILLDQRDSLCRLRLSSRRLADSGDIMPVRYVEEDITRRENMTELPFGELLGFLSPYHIERHFF